MENLKIYKFHFILLCITIKRNNESKFAEKNLPSNLIMNFLTIQAVISTHKMTKMHDL